MAALLKGQKISVNKEKPSLEKIEILLGWQIDLPTTGDAVPDLDLDLDVSAFLLTATGKVAGPKDFVFYGNLQHPSGSVVLSKNNRRNLNEYSVRINVDLSLIPPSVMRIAFTATIYEAESRKQSFSQVNDAFIKISDEQTKNEIVFYKLADKFNIETAVVFGELYRNNTEWKFNAMGSGYTGGLAALCRSYGVEVG